MSTDRSTIAPRFVAAAWRRATRMAAWGVVALAAQAGHAQALTGAGSSAAAPVYRAWAAEYGKAGGPELQYAPVGSGAGMERIRKREVDFGASDVIAARVQLEQEGLVMVPTVITAVVPVVNLPKAGATPLRLTGELLASILLGEVTRWDAPAIKSLNPSAVLPASPIRVVVRADGSGTTWNLSDYLSRVSEPWRARRGVANRHAWPAGFIAVKGSVEVSRTVRSTPGAIGYIDYNYVVDDGLTPVQMRNRDGAFVAVGVDTIRAAAVRSDWFAKGDFFARLNDLPGQDSWPIAMGTFVAVPRVARDAASTARALRFITWGYLHGDVLARRAKFVPLPVKVQANAYRQISAVTDDKGQAIGAQVLGAVMQR